MYSGLVIEGQPQRPPRLRRDDMAFSIAGSSAIEGEPQLRRRAIAEHRLADHSGLAIEGRPATKVPSIKAALFGAA